MAVPGRRLRDRRLDRRLERDGYVVVRAISPAQVQRSFEVYERFPSGIDAGYHASIHSGDMSYKVNVDAGLRPILWPVLDGLLQDHICLVAAMMVKPPTGSTEVPLHQDWNVIDESKGAGLTCWIPLTPITEREGLMKVLPGSHRLPSGLRGSPGFESQYRDIADRICEELLVEVPVGVGDVMIMDGRVLHTTGPNLSGNTRVAAYLNAIPAEAQPVHYYLAPDGQVEGYEVDLSFFTGFNIGERPQGRIFERFDSHEASPISMDELMVRRRAARRRTWRRGSRR